MSKLGIDLRSLPAQMVLSFVVLVLVTSVAVGAPAIWLIRSQLNRQAWAQVEQGLRAARALYTAEQSQVVGLATLTAQRPTLREAMEGQDWATLPAYLQTLQSGTALDVLVVCGPDGQVVAQTGIPVPDSVCSLESSDGFRVMSEGESAQAWLLARRPIGDPNLGGVIVGVAVDDEFAQNLRDETRLEHTLLHNGRPIATSFGGGIARWTPAARRLLADVPLTEQSVGGTYTAGGRPYYFTRLPIGAPGLEDEIALAVTAIVATQRRLGLLVAGSIVIVATLASFAGVLLARRISYPLTRLASAAGALSEGDLESSLAVEARVREVALLAQTLESARIDLLQTLTELRAEKAWVDNLLEAIVEGIVTVDRRGRITFFSQGAERITGWSRDAVLGRACDTVFRPVGTDEPFSELIPAPGRRHKITVVLAGGRQATLSVTGARLTPPEVGDTSLALVFRDVSEEEAIQRILGHFLSNVTHEFRTPLSALAASIELLMDQAPDLEPAELRELLLSLHLGILSLQTLVDNLLESASIEAGRFRVHPRATDLGNIIADAVQIMQPLLNKHGQRLNVELPAAVPIVKADHRRTVQVVVNLLANANKYGPDDSEIDIRATTSAGWARVAVADRGPGIPSQHRGELFKRFVHPTTDPTAEYGAGLGLWVVRTVVEAQGGQVGVNDRPGGGSIFWFSLPLG